MGWITAILGLLGKLLDYFTKKDQRDVSHDQGEAQGVAETQAATAQHAVQEARDAAKTQDDVGRLSDDALFDELQHGPKA